MLRQALILLLLVPTLFAGCRKLEPRSEFRIEGLRDVDLADSNGGILQFKVRQTSGIAQPVAISVIGPPDGITASVQPTTVLPDNSATITFSPRGTPGRYPIHILASSEEYSRSYDISLLVHPFNGFALNGLYYAADSLQVVARAPGSDRSDIRMHSSSHGGAYLVCQPGGTWPTADGTYEYRMGTEIKFTLETGTPKKAAYQSFNNDQTKIATVKIAGGKCTLLADQVPFINLINPGTKMPIIIYAYQ